MILNFYWCTWNDPQRLGKETAEIEIRRKIKDNSDHSIVKITLNTHKGPRDLSKIAVTQTLKNVYQLMLLGKTHEE